MQQLGAFLGPENRTQRRCEVLCYKVIFYRGISQFLVSKLFGAHIFDVEDILESSMYDVDVYILSYLLFCECIVGGRS